MKKKHSVLLVLSLFATGPALARSVGCMGANYDRTKDITVDLATAAKTKISGVVITEDDVVISRVGGAIEPDSGYRPTSPRYADMQRYAVDGTHDRLNLILPENKSGDFTAYLQMNIGTARAETVKLTCSDQ